MFDFRDLMTGFRDAIGKMADYQIIFSATGWHEKGVLIDVDLAELNELISAKNYAATVAEEEAKL